MRRTAPAFILIALGLVALGVVPAASQLTGAAEVLSSDTIGVNGQVHRLHGVDGLELHQFCFVNGRPWACGAAATRALQTLLDVEPVTCTPAGAPGAAESNSVCTMRLGDIAEIMVQRGWAIADPSQTDRYAATEATAREAGAGAWGSLFVAPWVYRDDMAAIQDRYAERVGAAMLAEAEAALAGGQGGIPVFEGFRVVRAGDAAQQELRVAVPAAGYTLDAFEAGETFTWRAVARALARWRDSVYGKLMAVVVNSAWTELTARPQTLVEVADAAGFYAALRQRSAPWIAQGRQPVLLVPAADNPAWIAEWLGAAPPEGAVVTRKPIVSPSYVGTVDGVDIYAGMRFATGADETPREALLLPNDLIVQVTYGPRDAGPLLTFARDADAEPDDLVFRYARSIEWRADPIVRMVYPYQGPAAFYGD